MQFFQLFVVVVVADVVVPHELLLLLLLCNMSFKCFNTRGKEMKNLCYFDHFLVSMQHHQKHFYLKRKFVFEIFQRKFFFSFFLYFQQFFPFFFIIYIFHNDAGREWVFRHLKKFCRKIKFQKKKKRKIRETLSQTNNKSYIHSIVWLCLLVVFLRWRYKDIIYIDDRKIDR